MSSFLGTHQNRLDAKGRVSVPAPFRAVLRGRAEAAGIEGPNLVLRPSHKGRCIEGWPADVFMSLAGPLDRIDLFSDDHDDMAAALYADAFHAESDKEGRIVLPELHIAHAGLTDTVVFMGLGRTFQIWEPAAADERRRQARERARTLNLTLPGTPAGAKA